MRRLGPALAVAVAVTCLLSTPAGSVAASRAASITRSAHIAYLSCPAPDVLLTGSIARRSFIPGQLVTYRVSIRDLSARPCSGPNGITLPTNPVIPAPGLLGPCGELSVTVYDSRGAQVYPGPIAPSCPLILGPSLTAGQTITTTGSWDPSAGSDGLGRPGFVPGVPRGHYYVVIDRKVTLPVDLVGPPAVPGPPATLPPSTRPPPTLPVPTVPPRTVPSPPLPPATTPVAPTRPTLPPGNRVTRSAHVAFDGCAAQHLTLTVTVTTGSGTSVPVRYEVAVHNGGGTPCGDAFRNDPPAMRRFRVGPCSAMPATVVNAFGVDVYPGPQVYMCPAFAGPYIAPHATVTASGTWPGTEYLVTPGGPEPHAAPPGAYKLFVDDAVKVPFTLTASP